METGLRRLRQQVKGRAREDQRSWVFWYRRLTRGGGEWPKAVSCRPGAALQRPASLQPPPHQSPPMRRARPTSGPSPLPPAPANSGSSSNPTKPTVAKGFKCPMSPMTVRHHHLVIAHSVPAKAWLGDSEMSCASLSLTGHKPRDRTEG